MDWVATDATDEVYGAAMSYTFTGKLAGDKISGALSTGEYQDAKLASTRHTFGRAQGDIA
jgi:hypothetical protein